MSPAGSTHVDWLLRAPRKGEAEYVDRVAKLMTRHRVAIDRPRVIPVSCTEGSGVGRSAGWCHSSGTHGRAAARQEDCFGALERTQGSRFGGAVPPPAHSITRAPSAHENEHQRRSFRGSHSAGAWRLRSHAALRDAGSIEGTETSVGSPTTSLPPAPGSGHILPVLPALFLADSPFVDSARTAPDPEGRKSPPCLKTTSSSATRAKSLAGPRAVKRGRNMPDHRLQTGSLLRQRRVPPPRVTAQGGVVT